MDGWTGRHPRVHYLGTGNRPVVASYFHSPSLLETKPEERLGVGHAALRAAGVLHALSRTAEPAPGVGARAQQGLGLRDGHGGRATERHRDLGRAGLRLPRLRTALCLHSPRRTRPGTRPGDRLVRLGVLLRRPLPRTLQAYSRSGRRQGVPGQAASVHAGRRRDHRNADQPGGTRPLRPVGPHRPEHVHGLAAPVRRKHQEPPRRVPVGTSQHQRGPCSQPRRIRRDAAQGRRRPLVGQPRRTRRRC